MKKFYGILVFLLISSAAISQTVGTVKGKLIDSTGKQSLKDATVSILNATDSTLEKYVLAKDAGVFQINNLAFGDYLLKITFKGYFPLNKKVSVSQSDPLLDLGNLYMNVSADTLPTVTVTESAIKMKKDTVEYNAGSFTTKPNAVAEDLLQKMPGFDVDKNGTVKHGGETVQRVLVDGKKFFGGDDPKMATRNLPPDVIDKIQVFDDLSDQSKFTGFDDGNRVKTINIVTKKDKRKGYFGKAVAGAGTEGTYDASVNMHRFDGNQQLSLLGQANDINKQNFTPQDIGGGRGGGGGNFGGNGSSNGINTTWAGGLNYRDAWGKNTDAYGSYFYNNQHIAVDKIVHSTSLGQSDSGSSTTNQYTDQTSSSISRTQNHRINFNLESKLDSVNSIVFRPTIVFQQSTPNSSSSSIRKSDPNNTLINQSVTTNSSTNNGFNIGGANFQFRHRFAKKFRTASLDLNFSDNVNNGDGYSYSVNSFYVPTTRVDTLNQYYVDTVHNLNISPTFSYTEPIAKNQIIELRYNYSYTKNNSINNTYEFDNASKGYSRFDSLYSNSYKYTNSSNRVTLSYRILQSKYNINIGAGVQFTDQSSINTTKSVTVSNNYVNFTPSANFTYNFARTRSLRIFYNGSTGQPSVLQLQPVTTISGLDTTIGNPNLRPQFTNSLRALYNSFDPITQRVIFATLNASMISNDIQTYTTSYLKTGTNKTAYVNLNGTYNIAGTFIYGFPLKKPKSNLNFKTDLSYSQNQTLLDRDTMPVGNYIHDYTRSTAIGETIKWTTNLKQNFDMNFSAGTSYTIGRHTSAPDQNTNYFTTTFSVDATYYTKSGWIIATLFDYTYYGGNVPSSYKASVPLINPSIAKQFLKNKAGELRLTIFDLLDQNTSISNVANQQGGFTSTRTTVLSRYAMLTFTYNLRNFAAQKQGQQQRMPGMFRGFDGGGGGNRGGGNGGFGGGKFPE